MKKERLTLAQRIKLEVDNYSLVMLEVGFHAYSENSIVPKNTNWALLYLLVISNKSHKKFTGPASFMLQRNIFIQQKGTIQGKEKAFLN